MIYDVAIIGGGINGVGVALEAASRGLSVVLCEQNDLASGTSSKSSKLIHGGLRYLEKHAFSLVKESLQERETLLKMAGHMITPIPFIIPFDKNIRKAWLIRLGLYCYDFLNLKNSLSHSKSLRLSLETSNPVKRSIKSAFQYYDCTIDDARLVVLLARLAKQHGAHIMTRTTCMAAAKDPSKLWKLSLKKSDQEHVSEVKARVLINASGPWLDRTMQRVVEQKSKYVLKQIKGSHILVPKLYNDNCAYLLQNKDNRVVFVIPYLNQFSLIGTTDIPFSGDPASAEITQAEIHYLCNTVNEYFHHPIKESHIKGTWAGVRALWDDGSINASSLPRECKIDHHKDTPPLINLFGGKLTTFRSLSEKVVDQLAPYFSYLCHSESAKLKLPGSMPPAGFIDLLATLNQEYSYLHCKQLERMANNYGHEIYEILHDCKSEEDLGQVFGCGLTQKEVDYLLQKEFAQTAEDILWRRTKLGYFFQPSQVQTLEDYLCKVRGQVIAEKEVI